MPNMHKSRQADGGKISANFMWISFMHKPLVHLSCETQMTVNQ